MKKRYLVYLNNQQKYDSKNFRDTLHKLRLILHKYSNAEEIRDIRISRYFVEMDIGSNQETIFLDNNQNFLSSIGTVGNVLFIEELTEERKEVSLEDTISTAICLFNLERFWKSHEVLESVWKDASGSTKRLLNGLILVDAAFVHLQKGELEIYFSILRRSLEKFEEAPEFLFNINMKLLVEKVEDILLKRRAFYFKIFIL